MADTLNDLITAAASAEWQRMAPGRNWADCPTDVRMRLYENAAQVIRDLPLDLAAEHFTASE